MDRPQVRAFLASLRPVDILRNAILYAFVRWFIWLFLRRLWPGYPWLLLDAAGTLAVFLDPPTVQNWWPRMVVSAFLVELLRYGLSSEEAQQTIGLIGFFAMLSVLPIGIILTAWRKRSQQK